jgi:cobalamin biosynthesis Mg chelatase CobN
LQRKAQDRREVRLPSRRGVQASPAMQRQGRSTPRPPARRPGRRHADRPLRTRRRPAPGRRPALLERVAPRFPLTLPAMSGTRQFAAPARGLSMLALSTLALLAMCCLPVFAQADSSGLQYQDAPPTVTGKTATSGNGGSASSSKDRDGQSTTGSGASDGGKSSGGGSSSKSGGAGGVAGEGGQGSSGDRSGEGKGPGNDSAKPGSTAQVDAQPTSSEDDGGSSPLVPILIAIAVLAAISIAVVVMRQRRQRDSTGSPVSPEAG